MFIDFCCLGVRYHCFTISDPQRRKQGKGLLIEVPAIFNDVSIVVFYGYFNCLAAVTDRAKQPSGLQADETYKQCVVVLG